MYLSAHWYSTDPKCGAIYVGRCSLHWGLDGPVTYRDGQVVTLRQQPRRTLTLYSGLQRTFRLTLWPSPRFCEHGFRKSAWWHRCDYVTAYNPDGRPDDRELWPDDYDEDGVHYMDRTCFCDMKPDYSICQMHPDEDDE